MKFRLPWVAAIAAAAGIPALGAGPPAAKSVAPTKPWPAGLTKVDSAVVGGVPMSRVIIQPNGWGNNPASATRDLDRIMRFYEGRPGFRRDRYVKIIEIGRGKFQSDGRCSYLAPTRRGTR